MGSRPWLHQALQEIEEKFPYGTRPRSSYSQEQTEQETEYTYYAKLSNPQQQLGEMSDSETHHQYERQLFDTEGEPVLRLRIRVIDENFEYPEFTIKRKLSGDGDKSITESTLTSTEDFYHLVRSIADRYLYKIRYIYYFNHQGLDLKWEIDAFITEDDEIDPWVKIDLEVPREDIKVPAFPLQVEELISADTDNEDEKATLDAFWNRVLRTVTS